MKQIKYIIFIFLLIPLSVYSLDNYEATIVANNVSCYRKAIDYSGDINYYKSSRLLKYNDKVRIKKNEKLKDTRLVLDIDGCYIKYNEFIGGNFDPKTFKITNYDKPRNIVLLTKKLNLYGGPNKDYLDFELEIDENIIFQYQYSIANKWFFIYYEPNHICNEYANTISCTSQGTNAMGWSFINNKDYGIDGDEIIIFPKDVNIIDNIGNTIGTIPKGKEITKYFYTYEENKKIIYVYYNNLEGYVYDIPLFKGKATINYMNNEINVNYYNFKYNDKAFIYDNNNLLELNYNDIQIINENMETKTNGYINDIFNKYKILKAPILNYKLEDSNKEDKESLPENYINKKIDNSNNPLDNNITDINNNEINKDINNNKNNNILYILASVILLLIIMVYISYIIDKKRNNSN